VVKAHAWTSRPSRVHGPAINDAQMTHNWKDRPVLSEGLGAGVGLEGPRQTSTDGQKIYVPAGGVPTIGLVD